VTASITDVRPFKCNAPIMIFKHILQSFRIRPSRITRLAHRDLLELFNRHHIRQRLQLWISSLWLLLGLIIYSFNNKISKSRNSQCMGKCLDIPGYTVCQIYEAWRIWVVEFSKGSHFDDQEERCRMKELIAFLWYDTDCIENDESNNASVVACVFVAAVRFLLSRR
jgi:hypothetical protein